MNRTLTFSDEKRIPRTHEFLPISVNNDKTVMARSLVSKALTFLENQTTTLSDDISLNLSITFDSKKFITKKSVEESEIDSTTDTSIIIKKDHTDGLLSGVLTLTLTDHTKK